MVPYTVFTDPELGRVCRSESQARDQGYTVRVAKLPMSHCAPAIESGETRGLIQPVVDGDTDRTLGCAMLCLHGGETMAMIQLVMMGELPYTEIEQGIFAHPTFAEFLDNLFMTLGDA